MGNNGGKYNINKIKKIFTGEEKPTKRKIMGGMKAITKKKEKTKSLNIISNLSASQTKYLGTESFVQLVTCVNNRNLVW